MLATLETFAASLFTHYRDYLMRAPAAFLASEDLGGALGTFLPTCFNTVVALAPHVVPTTPDAAPMVPYPVFHVIPHTLGITAQAYELPHE